jgi:hypothetical protein
MQRYMHTLFCAICMEVGKAAHQRHPMTICICFPIGYINMRVWAQSGKIRT